MNTLKSLLKSKWGTKPNTSAKSNLALEPLEARVLLSVETPLLDSDIFGPVSPDSGNDTQEFDSALALPGATTLAATQDQEHDLIFRELTTTTITVPVDKYIGQKALQAMMQNVSTEYINSPTIKYYLSTDQVFDESDTIWDAYISYVRPGQYFYIKPNVNLSAIEPLNPGTYYIKIQAEDNWSDLITLNVVGADAKPVIEISNVQISQTSFQQWEPYKATMTITNTGTADYMQDVIYDDDEPPAFRQWQRYWYPDAEPPYWSNWGGGHYFELDYNHNYTSDLDYIPVGQSVVGIFIDRAFWSGENSQIKYLSDYYSNVTDPQNDTFSQTFDVTVSGDYGYDRSCDVSATLSLGGDTEVSPGDRIPFEITVTNNGDLYTWGQKNISWPNGQYISLVLSKDEIIEPTSYSDTNIIMHNDWYRAPTLMPGESYSFTGEIVAPGEAGTFYVAALADSGGYLTESNEDNNQSVLRTFTVTSPKPQAEVTYPPADELLDNQELNDPTKHYIELTYSNTDEDTVDGDEISLAGIGADDLQIGSITKIEDGRYRYEVVGEYSTGPVEVQIQAETFTNDAQEPNAAETVSFLALPDLEPFVLTYDKNNLTWDGAQQKFSYVGQASLGMRNGGTVDPLITIDGTFNYDDLKIHFANVTVTSDIGNINEPLVTGTFDLDLKEKGWSTIEKLPSEMLVAGCLLTIDSVVFHTPAGSPTQIEIQGAIKLNPGIADVSIIVGGPHKIVIAPSGVSVTGGEMTFPDKEFKLLNTVDVKSTGVSVEYLAAEPNKTPTPLPDRLRIRGKFEFPEWWKATADLSKNTVDPSKDNYIEVSANDAEVKGAFSFGEIDWGLWAIKEFKLTVDTKQQLWQGDLAFKTPLSSKTIVGGAGIIQGEFNYIALGVDDLNIMIGTSPVFLQKIVGNVNHISDKDKEPISIGGQLAFTAGPELELWLPEQLGGKQEGSLAKLELEGEINVNQAKGYGKLTTIGDLLTGEVTAAIDYSKVTKDPNAGWGSILVTAKGEMKALWDMFVGQVSLTMDCRTETRLAASGNGKVSIPKYVPLWGGAEIASGEMLAKYNDDNNYKNDYLAAWGSVVLRKFGKAFKFTTGAKIDFEGNTTLLGSRGAAETKLSYSDFEQSILNPPAPTTTLQSAKLFYLADFADPTGMLLALDGEDQPDAASAFDIAADSPWALLTAQWDEGIDDAELIVIAPDGTVYYEADIQNNPEMILLDQDYIDANPDSNLSALPDNTRGLLIINPLAGQWKIMVDSDSSTISTPVYSGLFSTPAPEITITDVQSDGSKIDIDYTATDADNNAAISLYYDTDGEGNDGILIVAGLTPQGADSYTWKPDEVIAGEYYIYAVAEDEDNAPVVSYYASPVQVEEAPPAVEVSLGTGASSSVAFTDPDGTRVTVRLISATAELSIIGDIDSTTTTFGTTTIHGSNLELDNIDITGGSGILMISASGGDGTAQLGGITGESLRMVMARQVNLAGDIDLAGSLGMMMIGNIEDNSSVTTGLGANGLMVMAGDLGEVDFDIADKIAMFQATSFAGGSLIADNIGTVMLRQGDFSADVTARNGDIGMLMAAGDITGRLNAQNIKMIMARNGNVTGVLRAATDIGMVMAGNLNNAILSAGHNIRMVMTGDIIDSYLLAGYDIGSDCAFGLQQTGGGDAPGSGDIGMTMASGTFSRSYIGAGVLPYAPLTNQLPSVGLPLQGKIGLVRFGNIDYDCDFNFGLFAATSISGLGTSLNSQPPFLVEVVG